MIGKTLQETRELYNQLMNEKEKGKVFTRDDLTKDIVYQLAIEENVNDTLIGYIFNLSKNQVRYIRKKYNLQNKFMKNSIDHPEDAINYLKQLGLKDYSDSELSNIVYQVFKQYAKIKHWKIEKFDEYLNEKLNQEKDKNIDLSNLELEYDVVYVKKQHIDHKKTSNRKTSGSRMNQSKTNESKIFSGKLGEKIVYESEIKKINNLGLKHLIKEVKWISKTDKEDISFDGVGYDIVSFNELGEKIYIEVKCSTTNDTENVHFHISQKEVDFMNGTLKGIDKEHCFIYYVSNIKQQLQLAQIFIINHEIFSTYQLNATHYEINESCTNE